MNLNSLTYYFYDMLLYAIHETKMKITKVVIVKRNFLAKIQNRIKLIINDLHRLTNNNIFYRVIIKIK